MKAYSGSTSEGFLPASLPGVPPVATAPTPEDPSATFNDFLQQQTGPGLHAASVPEAGWMRPTTKTPWTEPAVDPTDTPNPTTEPSATGATTSTSFFGSSSVSLNWSKLNMVPADVMHSPVEISQDPAAPHDESALPPENSTDLPAIMVPRPPTKPGTAIPTTLPASSGDAGGTKIPISPEMSLQAFLATQNPPAGVTALPASPLPSEESGENEPTVSASPEDEAPSNAPATSPSPTVATVLSFSHHPWAGSSATLGLRTTTTAALSNSETGKKPSSKTGALSSSSSPSTGTSAPSTSAGPVRKSVVETSTAPDPTASISATPIDPTAFPNSPLAVLLAQANSLATTQRPPLDNPAASPKAPTTASALASDTAGFTAIATSGASSDKPSVAPVSVEKKSPARAVERSFIQSSVPTSTTTDATTLLLASAATVQPQTAFYQSLPSTHSATERGLRDAISGAATATGTMNGKKEVDMNATLEMPDLVVSSGTNPLVTKTSADVHILLGTNNDFHEAIDQVMHVAELSNLSRTSNPLRVAIEIQTPPGAIVNVYVSRQADSSYRAQLSTNDVQALSWVQDQIGSLKGSTDAGTDIRWAPAQLETANAPMTLASTNGGNLDWNRGGNQDGQQPSDEQPARHRPHSAPDEDDAELGIPFLETLGAIGSAA